MKRKMTPLESAMDDMRLDQAVVDDALEDFDFDLAAKLVAIYAEQRALADKRPKENVWVPSAQEMRARAAEIVLDVLKGGRKEGVGYSIHAAYMTARYETFEGVLEIVNLELRTIVSVGRRPFAGYLRDTRSYLAVMGGGWLDEDGRWHPGEPPSARRESEGAK